MGKLTYDIEVNFDEWTEEELVEATEKWEDMVDQFVYELKKKYPDRHIKRIL